MSKWLPPNVSTFGEGIDSVFWLIFWLGLFWFTLAEGAILFFIVKYRRRPGKRGSHLTGGAWKQSRWILIPGAIVLVLDLAVDFAGGHAYEAVKGELPESDVEARVQAEQYAWRITYPGPDGMFDTADDLGRLNQLYVPANRPVRIYLTSTDVIHSFFAPQLRLKQDAVPGREIPLWFDVTEPGQYEIACAELCGPNHYTMRGFLNALTPAEYEDWVKKTWSATAAAE